MIGIVIPTINEAETLPLLLQDLRGLSDSIPLDVVVADGGSSDGTWARAESDGARVVHTSGGRAHQLNAGAAAVKGDWLLFLHADCRLTPACRAALSVPLQDGQELRAAVFRFAIDLPPGWKQLIEWGQALRQAVFRLPYGDQGLLVRRSLFNAAGGFPEIPLMEDVAMIRRLRQQATIRTLPASLLSSGRRYRAKGVIRTGLLHTVLILLYMVGVSPHRLAQFRDAGPAAH